MSFLKLVLRLLIVLGMAYELLTHRPFVVGVPEEELDALDEKYMRWFWLRPVCFLGVVALSWLLRWVLRETPKLVETTFWSGLLGGLLMTDVLLRRMVRVGYWGQMRSCRG